MIYILMDVSILLKDAAGLLTAVAELTGLEQSTLFKYGQREAVDHLPYPVSSLRDGFWKIVHSREHSHEPLNLVSE